MTDATSIPTLALRDGVSIPQLGFGVFQVPPEETQSAVEEALAVGYRHIDTAAAYRNEAGVGAAIAASGLAPRRGLRHDQALEHRAGLRLDPARLRAQPRGSSDIDHVDLYLIHWPVPSEDRFLDTWRAFEQIKAEGRARSIGVSNFRVEDLERLEREAEELPTVNQIELHPQPPAGRAARLARRARHRHRGLEPARPGRAARRRDDRDDRRPPRAARRPR